MASSGVHCGPAAPHAAASVSVEPSVAFTRSIAAASICGPSTLMALSMGVPTCTAARFFVFRTGRL